MSLATIFTKTMQEDPFALEEDSILQREESVDLMPGNIALSAVEDLLVNTTSRETVLRGYINTIKDRYDYVLIVCMPSFGMMTINALAAADSVITPVQSHFLPAKGIAKTTGRKPVEYTSECLQARKPQHISLADISVV